MKKEEIIAKLSGILSDRQYIKIRKKIIQSKMAWCIGECDLHQVEKGTLDTNINTSDIVVNMKKGIYDYEYFNVCFLNNVISFIIMSVAEKKIPRIEILNENGENIWEQFFVQPYSYLAVEACESMEVECDNAYVFPNWDEVFSEKRVKLWGKIYQKYVIFNQRTQDYIDSEVRNVLKKQRVLGVLLRGTDYIACKPKGHPVQPDLNDVIKMIQEKIEKLKCDKVYLATEDSKIQKELEKEFPGKILINKRVYYDKVYKHDKCEWIRDVHFDREHDNYLKGLEYLSSLTILSRCNALIAGNCGGTQMAVFLNDNKYEEKYIFDLGLYE